MASSEFLAEEVDEPEGDSEEEEGGSESASDVVVGVASEREDVEGSESDARALDDGVDDNDDEWVEWGEMDTASSRWLGAASGLKEKVVFSARLCKFRAFHSSYSVRSFSFFDRGLESGGGASSRSSILRFPAEGMGRCRVSMVDDFSILA